MIPNHNLITDREQVRVNQWWTSASLCDIRGDAHDLVTDHVNRLAVVWKSSSDYVDNRTLRVMCDGLMPKKNHLFERQRMAYPFDCNRGEVPDDYNDDARRANLSVPQWFALMLRTWLCDTTHYIVCDGEVNTEHSEHHSAHVYDHYSRLNTVSDLRRLPSVLKFGRHPGFKMYDAAGPQYYSQLWNDLTLTAWPQRESLQEARREYIGGMTQVIENALQAIPTAEEVDVRANMRLVMDEIEPYYIDRAQIFSRYELAWGQEDLLRLHKCWFGELRDMYVYGIKPPTPFDYKTYAVNAMHCGIRDKFPDVRQITNMHVTHWRRIHAPTDHAFWPYNESIYRIITGEFPEHNQWHNDDSRAILPSLTMSIAEQRTTSRVSFMTSRSPG